MEDVGAEFLNSACACVSAGDRISPQNSSLQTGNRVAMRALAALGFHGE
jgi:hypothetical protein